MGINCALDALDLLLERGWIKYLAESDQGFCLLGALSEVSEDRSLFRMADAIATEQFPDRTLEHCFEGVARPAAQFNDHEDTVFDDVVLVLEKLARTVEESTAP